MSSRAWPPVCRCTAVISVSSAWSQSAARSAVAIFSSGRKAPRSSRLSTSPSVYSRSRSPVDQAAVNAEKSSSKPSGRAGFAPLSRNRTVNVIMPDVKHCGGLLELTRIAAAAEQDGVLVAPHNPSGPVSTAANVQVCSVLRNFRLLEFQWGEVGWRSDVVTPVEFFDRGTLHVSSRPGFGIDLNERLVRSHLM